MKPEQPATPTDQQPESGATSRSKELLEATIQQIRTRIGEVKAGYERNRTFYITHQNYLNAGVYDLRLDGLNDALGALDNALSESPATCHLQASNAELCNRAVENQKP